MEKRVPRSLWPRVSTACPSGYPPFLLITFLPVNPHRSPQPNDRAQRVSERGSGISSVPAFFGEHFVAEYSLPHEALSWFLSLPLHIKPVYTPLALRDWFRAAPRNPLKALTRPPGLSNARSGREW